MRIVTISREVGSLGDVIASIVARQSALELITRSKVHELAQTCDPQFSEACSIYETEHGPGFFERIFFDRPAYTSLFEALTFEEASRGNAVILGRGSQIVLRDFPGVFKVRVVAPLKLRIERIAERYNYSREEAEAVVKKYDHHRKNLTRAIFDHDPDDWALYDLIINTSQLSASAASAATVEAVTGLEPVPNPEEMEQRLKNMALAKRIESLIRRKISSVGPRDVGVSATSEGTVTIEGSARTKQDRESASKIARDYPGVTSVENNIKVVELQFGL